MRWAGLALLGALSLSACSGKPENIWHSEEYAVEEYRNKIVVKHPILIQDHSGPPEKCTAIWVDKHPYGFTPDECGYECPSGKRYMQSPCRENFYDAVKYLVKHGYPYPDESGNR